MLVYPLHSYISVYMHLVTFVSANIVHDLVSALSSYICRHLLRMEESGLLLQMGIGMEMGVVMEMEQNVNTDEP